VAHLEERARAARGEHDERHVRRKGELREGKDVREALRAQRLLDRVHVPDAAFAQLALLERALVEEDARGGGELERAGVQVLRGRGGVRAERVRVEGGERDGERGGEREEVGEEVGERWEGGWSGRG
jgi:hypothetical protein